MREILPGRLWLGNATDGGNVVKMNDVGIQAIVKLAFEEANPSLPRSMLFFRIPIIDGGEPQLPLLRLAVAAVIALHRNEIPTLVICGSGMSRAPAVVAGAIAVLQDRSPDDCLREIALGNPCDVSPKLWEGIREVCRELRGST